MRRDRITLCALYAGMAVPLLYFGVQALASPFFPEFSFVGTTASELGSDLSSPPAIFNYGTMLQGVAWFIASIGFFRTFRRLGVHPVLAGSISLAVIVGGIGSFWAASYPLPDPRHAGHPSFLVALLALPILLAVTFWKQGNQALRVYLVANLVLLGVMVLIISGISGLDAHTYRGLFQKVFALTVFVPIGVATFVLARRLKAMPER